MSQLFSCSVSRKIIDDYDLLILIWGVSNSLNDHADRIHLVETWDDDREFHAVSVIPLFWTPRNLVHRGMLIVRFFPEALR